MLLIILLLGILNEILISQKYLLRLCRCRWRRLECQIIRFLNFLLLLFLFFIQLVFRISSIISIISLVCALSRRKSWLESIKMLLKILLYRAPNIISKGCFLSFLNVVLLIFVIILLKRCFSVEILSIWDVIFRSIVRSGTLLVSILWIVKSIGILVDITKAQLLRKFSSTYWWTDPQRICIIVFILVTSNKMFGIHEKMRVLVSLIVLKLTFTFNFFDSMNVN
jgi:hypothetical protein